MTTENLDLWEKVRTVPPTAKKDIPGGRLKGMTDINPVWRQKVLTEQFGPCGFGWKYTITKQWLENGGKDEISAFVNINLYIKVDGEWSEPIPGTGGSSFVANESKGLYTSDECFKMALTDAISVSCKALGFGADVYWAKDTTKYTNAAEHDAGQGNGKPAPAQANRSPNKAPTVEPKAGPNDAGFAAEVDSAIGNSTRDDGTVKCGHCGLPATEDVVTFSEKKKWPSPLCWDCQTELFGLVCNNKKCGKAVTPLVRDWCKDKLFKATYCPACQKKPEHKMKLG